MSKFSTLLIVAATAVVSKTVAGFEWPRPSGLPGKCPTPASLQTDWVKQNFDEHKMQGFYYEIAMKDATQPRFCSCQTSNKTMNDDGTLRDDFRIQCYGDVYLSDLQFYMTDEPGVSIGKWNNVPVIDKVDFPNTVVDVGLDAEGNYEWLIEFQCVQGPKTLGQDWISFYAFNFYHKKYDQANVMADISLMETKARAAGLSEFIDSGLGIKVVDHTDCIHGH